MFGGNAGCNYDRMLIIVTARKGDYFVWSISLKRSVENECQNLMDSRRPIHENLLKTQYWPLRFARICCCFDHHDSEASIVFRGLLLSRQTFAPATCYSAAFTFWYVGNNSNTHTMDAADSISLLSEGTAAVNAYCVRRQQRNRQWRNRGRITMRRWSFFLPRSSYCIVNL